MQSYTIFMQWMGSPDEHHQAAIIIDNPRCIAIDHLDTQVTTEKTKWIYRQTL